MMGGETGRVSGVSVSGDSAAVGGLFRTAAMLALIVVILMLVYALLVAGVLQRGQQMCIMGTDHWIEPVDAAAISPHLREGDMVMSYSKDDRMIPRGINAYALRRLFFEALRLHVGVIHMHPHHGPCVIDIGSGVMEHGDAMNCLADGDVGPCLHGARTPDRVRIVRWPAYAECIKGHLFLRPLRPGIAARPGGIAALLSGHPELFGWQFRTDFRTRTPFVLVAGLLGLVDARHPLAAAATAANVPTTGSMICSELAALVLTSAGLWNSRRLRDREAPGVADPALDALLGEAEAGAAQTLAANMAAAAAGGHESAALGAAADRAHYTLAPTHFGSQGDTLARAFWGAEIPVQTRLQRPCRERTGDAGDPWYALLAQPWTADGLAVQH